MILIDTSVWADHFRKADPALTTIGRAGEMLIHPFIVGELVAGNLPQWDQTLAALKLLPCAPVLGEDSYYSFVRQNDLMGSGLSFVDIHLLGSVMRLDNGRIWTRDKRLAARAEAQGRLYLPA